MPPSNSGPLELDAEYRFKMCMRKGDIRENPWGGKTGEFKLKISEGLWVAKAKALTFVSWELPNQTLMNEDMHFKKSKGAAQSQCISLGEQNFEQLMWARWNLITQRDVDTWRGQGHSVLEGFAFEVFLCIHRRAPENVPVDLCRATASQIETAQQQMRQHTEEQNVDLGPSPNNIWLCTRRVNRKGRNSQCRPTTLQGRHSRLI